MGTEKIKKKACGGSSVGLVYLIMEKAEKLDKAGLIAAARIAEAIPDPTGFWDGVAAQLDAAEGEKKPKVEPR